MLVEWEVAAPTHVQALADCHDVALVGGKAVGLGELMRAGLPVPAGFAVTTDAYRRVLEQLAALRPSCR